MGMKLAAVRVIADAAREEEILPEPLEKALHLSVAQAVEQVARQEMEALADHVA
jgi:hypothetical protein